MNNFFLKIIFATSLSLIAVSDFSYAKLQSEMHLKNNNYASGTLEISLRDSEGKNISDNLFDISEIKPGEDYNEKIKIRKEGSLDFKYNFNIKIESEDETLCKELNIRAKRGDEEKYDGKIADFDIDNSIKLNGDEDDWEFKLHLNNDNPDLRNKTCKFKIQAKAKQNDVSDSWGFSDSANVDNKVTSGSWDNTEDTPIEELTQESPEPETTESPIE